MKDDNTFDDLRLLSQLSDIEPPPEVVQRALERTREALANSPIPARDASQANWSHPSWHVLRVAAAIVAMLLVGMGGAYFLFFASSGATSALAQMHSAIEKVPCVACLVEVEWTNAPKDFVARPGTQVIDLASNRVRFETADGALIFLADNRRGVFMTLHPTQKRADIMRSPSTRELPAFSGFLLTLRNCDANEVEQLTDGDLEGQTVERFRVLPESPYSGGAKMVVFVDPQTHLPVRIEIEQQWPDKVGGLHVVCKDFSFSERNPSLFSMVPPEGYQVIEYLEGEPGTVRGEPK